MRAQQAALWRAKLLTYGRLPQQGRLFGRFSSALWTICLACVICALPLPATPTSQNPAPDPAPDSARKSGDLHYDQLMLGDAEFASLANKRVNIIDIMRAHEQRIHGKSTQEKILYYQKLLEASHITARPMPYKSQDYIEARFGDKPESTRLKRAEAYSLADRKSGAFGGVMLGATTLTQNYQDGLYNRTNNVPEDDGGICTDMDKSGCKRSGVFLGAANPGGINLESSLLVFGGGLGYQKFFNPYFGTRLYGDGMLSTGSEKLEEERVGSLWYVLGGMNIDLLAELPFSVFVDHWLFKESAIGVYGGISIGVMLLFDKASEGLAKHLASTPSGTYQSKDVLWNYLLQVDYGFNLGVSFSITPRYKLDVGAKVPMSAVGLPSELRLGLESSATYSDGSIDTLGKPVLESIVSKDIAIRRTPSYYVSFIMLF